MAINTKSIKGRYNKDFKNIPLKEGDFCYDFNFTHIYVILPGTKCPDALAINKGSSTGDRVWGWDGNIESPTLTPSILSPNEWHGYLKNGKFESC